LDPQQILHQYPAQVLEPKDGKVVYRDWDKMGSEISEAEVFDDDEQPLPQNVSQMCRECSMVRRLHVHAAAPVLHCELMGLPASAAVPNCHVALTAVWYACKFLLFSSGGRTCRPVHDTQ
jgi:hypothetical protein